MLKEAKEARAAARKRREAWIADVNQRWSAYAARWLVRPNPMAPDPITPPSEQFVTGHLAGFIPAAKSKRA